jgi:hypothetical protein
MEDFSFKFKKSYLQHCLYYKYCQKLTLQDNYWRFSFSATCSALASFAPEAPCTGRLYNWRLVLPRLHPPEPWGSTTSYMPRLGWGWTSPDASHKLPDARGLPLADQPMELSLASPGEAPAVLQWVRHLQSCNGPAASRNLRGASAEIYSS